jgi:hypothetical protein
VTGFLKKQQQQQQQQQKRTEKLAPDMLTDTYPGKVWLFGKIGEPPGLGANKLLPVGNRPRRV